MVFWIKKNSLQTFLSTLNHKLACTLIKWCNWCVFFYVWDGHWSYINAISYFIFQLSIINNLKLEQIVCSIIVWKTRVFAFLVIPSFMMCTCRSLFSYSFLIYRSILVFFYCWIHAWFVFLIRMSIAIGWVFFAMITIFDFFAYFLFLFFILLCLILIGK